MISSGPVFLLGWGKSLDRQITLYYTAIMAESELSTDDYLVMWEFHCWQIFVHIKCSKGLLES